MPGVPPDAIDNLKRAFKGLFKRGKKSKTSTPASAYSDQPPQSCAGASEAAAPQLPPIQNNSPLQSATEPSKPLPPTHPLSTGQLQQPVEAVPPNKDAQPGPPAPIVGPAETAEQVQEQQKDAAGAISPPEPSSTVDGARSGDLSAVTNDASPREPVKTDSAVEGIKTEEPAAPVSQPPTANNENIPPSTTTNATEDKSAPNAAPLTVSTASAAPTGQTEEKVAVMDEPPPIKAAKPAPGMSATSGPLEDFPEGGDMRDM